MISKGEPMRLRFKGTVLLGVLTALILLAGCENVLNEEGDEGAQQSSDETIDSALSGRWTVWEYPGSDWEDHFTLVFDDTPNYSIEGRDGVVFETGPISNAADGSFDYAIDQADHAPSIVGNENYAEYAVDGDQLSITFYDDETKATAFGTLKAQRMELALIYQGADDDGNYETWIQIYNDAFPVDIWYGDSTSTTANDTAEYIWVNLTDSSQNIGVDPGTYTFPDGGINVLADATDVDIANDGDTASPDIYYDTRPSSGPTFTRTEVISDGTVTIGRDGDLYEITLSYTFESGDTLQKHFKLPVAREYDMSG